MKFIKLSIVQDFVDGEFELYLNAQNIEWFEPYSISIKDNGTIKGSRLRYSGTVSTVKENPEKIINLINGERYETNNK